MSINPPAPLDPLKFSAIAHTGMAFWNPISAAVMDRWIDALTLTESSRVLDVGCGRAEFLRRVVTRFGCYAIGVDSAPFAIDEAVRLEATRATPGRIELRCEPFDAQAFESNSLDLACCIGSSHAIANLVETLRVLQQLVKPGGLLLVGDGYWKAPPHPDYLAFLGCAVDDLQTHAGNSDLATNLGLTVVDRHEASDIEWSAYEDGYAENIQAYLKRHPDDPDAAAMRDKINSWRDVYLTWGRETLGFGLYLLRSP